ncbi:MULTISPECIES: DUF2812 domain-containing protein [unclassified Luteococcus]|uniref:DUF2812 domain-containing protein n=1 Tax=unclassified Luteococcus TaxID=2639923 RepID=UPI00313B55D9
MTTTRTGHGLAVSPEKDMAMFATMARRGKHLSGVSPLAHGFTFTDGPAEELVFDLAYEKDPTPDYFDIFSAAGWSHVLSVGNAHIFKAAPGTPPLHLGTDSKRDELIRNRNRYALYTAIALAVLLLVGLVVRNSSWNVGVKAPLITVAIIPVVYTAVPLLGYLNGLRKLGR